MSIRKSMMVSIITIAFLLVAVHTQNECSTTANSYWTGYRCACKVGYKNQSNACVTLTLLKSQGWVVRQPTVLPNSTDNSNPTAPVDPVIIVNTNCYLPFEYFNGQGCVCLSGYSRIGGLCQINGNNNGNNNSTTCPSNSVLVNSQCVCLPGYTKTNGVCVSSNSACGANSYDNGLGVCICAVGFYNVNNVCIAGSPCPPSSSRNSAGVCVCDTGFTKYGNYCAKCSQGAIYDSASQKCIFVCGQNSVYNSTSAQCGCLSGYGIIGSSCGICPPSYWVQNNYCVTCTINSLYNPITKKCECSEGYSLSKNGICTKNCGNNQVYNVASTGCDCVAGLGRVNGVCQVCPIGSTVTANGTCGACGLNQVFSNGNCICAAGYIPNQQNVCTQCASVAGSFLINGQCATCPGDLVYNGQTCACPSGSTKIGSKCQLSCNSDELVDTNGLCYSCPIYEIISNGVCVCQTNYIRNSVSGQCQLSCPSNQFIYQGRCAQCPLNLQYRPEIRGCACSDGQYLNTYGVCEQVILPPISCNAGFYLDSKLGCIACPSGCTNCTSASNCVSCSQVGFKPFNGICKALCGDGIIASTQTCDDSNAISGDGCSNTCQVQSLWACTGQPSVCAYTGPAVCGDGILSKGQACDDGNLINGDGCSSVCQIESKNTTNTTNSSYGLSLVGKVNTNSNNVFVVLKTTKAFTFVNQNDMLNFMQVSFPNASSTPSVFCNQLDAPNLDTFNCLALYSSGIPNKNFTINFSYNYQGSSGFLAVNVNPLASSSVGTRAIRN